MAPRTACALVFAALALAATRAVPAAADLTDTEQRWLAGATPPVMWAIQQGMPVDVVVLPRAEPGAAPLAMGYEDGRCKLVLAMRGNPAAETTLASIPAPLLQAALEAMTAHEIGHCQRHRSGAFDSTYRATHTDGRYRVTMRFRTFAGETLSLGFELPAGASRASLREFGIADDELDALLKACMASSRCEQRDFDRQTTRYYRDHALRLRRA